MSNLLAHEIAQRHDDLPFPYIMLTPASQAEQVCCQNLLAHKIAQRHDDLPFPYIMLTPASQAEQVCCQTYLLTRLPNATTIFRSPTYGLRECATSMLLSMMMSCGCHGNVTAHCRYSATNWSITASSILAPSP